MVAWWGVTAQCLTRPPQIVHIEQSPLMYTKAYILHVRRSCGETGDLSRQFCIHSHPRGGASISFSEVTLRISRAALVTFREYPQFYLSRSAGDQQSTSYPLEYPKQTKDSTKPIAFRRLIDRFSTTKKHSLDLPCITCLIHCLSVFFLGYPFN